MRGLKDNNHLSSAYLHSDDVDRKACEAAITDISEDQFLLEDMEEWASYEEANYTPFYGEERKTYKMKLERATYDTSKPARNNQPKRIDYYEMNFLSQSGIRLHDPNTCGELMIHKHEQNKQEIKQKEKIQKAQSKAQLKTEPKPEPKLEPCETYEEVKRWMEMAHPEYIDEEMMKRIEEKCRVIEKEF